jgi:hypothetical protein
MCAIDRVKQCAEVEGQVIQIERRVGVNCFEIAATRESEQ